MFDIENWLWKIVFLMWGHTNRFVFTYKFSMFSLQHSPCVMLINCWKKLGNEELVLSLDTGSYV